MEEEVRKAAKKAGIPMYADEEGNKEERKEEDPVTRAGGAPGGATSSHGGATLPASKRPSVEDDNAAPDTPTKRSRILNAVERSLNDEGVERVMDVSPMQRNKKAIVYRDSKMRNAIIRGSSMKTQVHSSAGRSQK